MQNTIVTATRWHEIDMGHTVTGHGGKCANLHGHRYKFKMDIQADSNFLDKLGMVLDFGVIKSTLCKWLNDNWDHRFLISCSDPRAPHLVKLDDQVRVVNFNPTAENIASAFLHISNKKLLPDGYTLVSVTLNETRKCSATVYATQGRMGFIKGTRGYTDEVATLYSKGFLAENKANRYEPPIKPTGFATTAPKPKIKPKTKPVAQAAPHVKRAIYNLLKAIEGVNSDRQGLLDTPARVAKAYRELYRGYNVDIASLFTSFEDGAEGTDEMVVVKNIPFYSNCEHHMLPFFGTVTVGYIPNGRIVGLSKLNRLVDAFARRLQVQERLTCQIADALEKHLQVKGVGVHITARHLCMESRGVCQQGHHTETIALRGFFKNKADTRAEFTRICK